MRTYLAGLLRLLVLVGLVLTFAQKAYATTHYVATTGSDSNPGTQAQPFQTIQKGINTAVNSDTVLVAGGTYTGVGNKNLNFGGKNITLQSLTGALNCIIDCQGSGASWARGFAFESGETAQCVLDGFTVRNGFDPSNGAAMDIYNSSPTIRNCVFADNTASGSIIGQGGAVTVRVNAQPTFTGCAFFGNRSTGSNAFAGGLQIGVKPECTVVVTNTTIQNNTAEALNGEAVGGGITVPGGTLRLINCIVSGNRALGTARALGGGMGAQQTGQIIVTNCTVMGNTAATGTGGSGGGAAVRLGGLLTLTNTIVYGNTSPFGPEISDTDGTVNVTYSDIKGGYPGEGNIDADPLFLDPTAGDFRLQANSPCIRAGTASAPNLPATDFTGITPRNFGGVDMGAFEYMPANALFIDQATGSDTNPGTMALPFQTVARALTAAVDPNTLYTIYIKAGNYGSDRPRVTGKVRFVNWGNVGQARIGKP